MLFIAIGGNTLPILIFMITTLATATTKDTPPNVIIIVADDLGWNDVSFHGSQQISTPNIDALAYSGIILNNYYVQPICTPTRSALLTGRHPIHTGLQHSVIAGAQPYGLGLNETLLSQYLKHMGYATHAVGKWHLGFFMKEYTPTFRGFDSHYGYWQGAEDYWDHTYLFPYKNKGYVGVDFHEDLDTVREEAGNYSTEIFTTRAQQVINNHNTSQPLFLYLAHQAVHSSCGGRAPLQAPEKYIEMFSHIEDQNRRVFAAMTAVLDESIGNVTTTLHEKGMLNNSIIIFTTDNGGPAAGFDVNWACNLPLRGRKASIWEGGTRGAGFIWSPLLQKTGEVSNQMMVVEDWLPTILAAVGYDTSSLPTNIDGMNMWDALNNPRAPSPRNAFLYNIDPDIGAYAVRVGNYKLIRETESVDWYECPGIPQPKYGIDKHEKSRKEEEENNVVPRKHKEKSYILNNGRHSEHVLMSTLYPIFQNMGLTIKNPRPVVVECGPKPANASTNCNPEIAPCLFDLSKDPCEYNNLAASSPDTVMQLQKILQEYNSTAVPPKNLPQDPNGLPTNHHNAWEVWVNL